MVYFRFHKNAQVVPLLGQIIPIETLIPYFFGICLNIITPFKSRSTKLFPPFRFYDQTFV